MGVLMMDIKKLSIFVLTLFVCACGAESILDEKNLTASQLSARAALKNGIIFKHNRINVNGKPNVEQIILAIDEQLLDRKNETALSAVQLRSIRFSLTGAQADLFKIQTRTLKGHNHISDGEHQVLVFNPNNQFFYDEVFGKCNARNCAVTLRATTDDGKQAVALIQLKLIEQDKFKINKVLDSLWETPDDYAAKTIYMLARASAENQAANVASNHFYLPMFELMKGNKPVRDEDGNVEDSVMQDFWQQAVLSELELKQLKYDFFDDNTTDAFDDSQRFSIRQASFNDWQQASKQALFMNQKNKSGFSGGAKVLNFYAHENKTNIQQRLSNKQVAVVAFKAPTLKELQASNRLQTHIALKEGSTDSRACNLFGKPGTEIKFYGPYSSSLLITPTDPDNLPIRLNLKVYVLDNLLPYAVKSQKFYDQIIRQSMACWPVDYNAYEQQGVDVRYVSVEQLQDVITWSKQTFASPAP